MVLAHLSYPLLLGIHVGTYGEGIHLEPEVHLMGTHLFILFNERAPPA